MGEELWVPSTLKSHHVTTQKWYVGEDVNKSLILKLRIKSYLNYLKNSWKERHQDTVLSENQVSILGHRRKAGKDGGTEVLHTQQ